MEAKVQTIKTYTVTLDETEMLELCEEISNLGMRSIDIPAMHNLRTILEVLV